MLCAVRCLQSTAAGCRVEAVYFAFAAACASSGLTLQHPYLQLDPVSWCRAWLTVWRTDYSSGSCCQRLFSPGFHVTYVPLPEDIVLSWASQLTSASGDPEMPSGMCFSSGLRGLHTPHSKLVPLSCGTPTGAMIATWCFSGVVCKRNGTACHHPCLDVSSFFPKFWPSQRCHFNSCTRAKAAAIATEVDCSHGLTV